VRMLRAEEPSTSFKYCGEFVFGVLETPGIVQQARKAVLGCKHA
jgi:hypothetical protein